MKFLKELNEKQISEEFDYLDFLKTRVLEDDSILDLIERQEKNINSIIIEV